MIETNFSKECSLLTDLLDEEETLEFDLFATDK